MNRLTMIFDLDETICTKKKPDESYADVLPIQDMIDLINEYYNEGHEIIIETARNMVTQNNNESKVIRNIGQVTLEWLEKHNVKYHGIKFGKSYGHIYVDDKSCINDVTTIRQRVKKLNK